MSICERSSLKLAWLLLASLLGLSSLAAADSVGFVFDTPDQTHFTPPGTGLWGTMTLTLNPDGTIGLNAQASPGFQLSFFLFNPPSGVNVSGMPPGWSFAAPITYNDGEFGAFSGFIGQGFGSTVNSLALTISDATPFTSVLNLVNPSTNNGAVPFIPAPFLIYVGDASKFGDAAALAPVPESGTFGSLGTGIISSLLFTRGFRKRLY